MVLEFKISCEKDDFPRSSALSDLDIHAGFSSVIEYAKIEKLVRKEDFLTVYLSHHNNLIPDSASDYCSQMSACLKFLGAEILREEHVRAEKSDLVNSVYFLKKF
ncbi:hypothetical protein COS83_03690 [archaeon CG07_land_8_20_14_0_80_38_8]|nr:MAG: hypothetical protein COS83_03690 [archaeon CG07_land_8_20_14_0_80_38_8]PIU89569.1 MAG: hypothetical protein COS64_00590 [archaeon CG06_land_8_20_14_3_00_37_11]